MRREQDRAMNDPPFATCIYEKRGPVAYVTLNRPEVVNAFNIQMRDDLWEVFGAVADDPDVRVLVLCGAGSKGFCSGADLTEFGTAPSQAVARRVRWQRDVFGRLLRLPKPAVAALHGHVVGSGIEMALLCDIRVASTDAVFSMPETALGLIPGAGGTQTLPRFVRPGRAFEMLLAGHTLDAGQALSAGLVQYVVPPEALHEKAEEMAGRLALLRPAAAAAAKRALRAALDMPLEAGLATEYRMAAGLMAGATR